MIRLLKFRTQNFRSIQDSGWIDVNDDVTSLVGINESGKSNLLLSLWKFHPAREGAIDPIADYPRDRYNEIRSLDRKPVFISTRFLIDDHLASQLARLTRLDKALLTEVEISRRLDEKYVWSFPNCNVPRSVASERVSKALAEGLAELKPISPYKQEADLKSDMIETISNGLKSIENDNLSESELSNLISSLDIDREAEAKSSKIGPIYDYILEALDELYAESTRPDPTQVEGTWSLVFENLPKFVYYSNYGNLDSEIYLPHVIDNLERDDLGEKEAAKARTLKVLFEFVNLSANEILELGIEADQSNVTEETIESDARNKKEREILLTSASTQLTTRFREWWKQGDYRFRFVADGNFFRIWVSDDIRPEEIELEGRSTGLQWFFSFYLVFLVESKNSHHGTILLLDEAGLSLHPLAQANLCKFFESLPNQIVFTTHSPFLLEADGLDRVRSVYIDEDGRTVVSPDLKASAKTSSSQGSVYPVHVALGLSVSDTFLLGCKPIVVEGVSDQRYLTAIKNYLIGRKRIAPEQDIVFLPAGGSGTKGISAVVAIVTAKEEKLPHILLDSDEPANKLKKQLLTSTYKGADDRISQVAEYGLFDGAEIEDLIPKSIMAKIITRYLPKPPGLEDEFKDVIVENRPLVPQVENYVKDIGISLEAGWKVEVATMFKKALPRTEVQNETVEIWAAVFKNWVA